MLLFPSSQFSQHKLLAYDYEYPPVSTGRISVNFLQNWALGFYKMASSFEMNDMKKIGLGLTGFGIFFTFLGVVFLFDKGLLAMGNILFLSGLALTIGPKSTLQFFMKPQNYKGTISFGVGFFFVIIGWPILGMILESYGFIVLFSGFWPTIAVFLQRIPVLGWVLQHPFFRSLMDRYRGKRVPV